MNKEAIFFKPCTKTSKRIYIIVYFIIQKNHKARNILPLDNFYKLLCKIFAECRLHQCHYR